MFIGMIGGAFGIILGLALSLYIPQFGIPTLVRIESIIQAFLFAFFVGLLAGLYPAWRASKLNPVEAMRSG
jgi:putative ABC transport system permease protein